MASLFHGTISYKFIPSLHCRIHYALQMELSSQKFGYWISDQFTNNNNKLITDELKIGYRLSRGGQSRRKGWILRKDISNTIKKLFSDEGIEVNKNVEALRDRGRIVVLRGGYSDINIEIFIEGLKRERIKK